MKIVAFTKLGRALLLLTAAVLVSAGAAGAGAPASGDGAVELAPAAVIEGVKIFLHGSTTFGVEELRTFEFIPLPERSSEDPDGCDFWTDCEDYEHEGGMHWATGDESVAKVVYGENGGTAVVKGVAVGETWLSITLKNSDASKQFSDSVLLKVISRDDYIAAHKALLESSIDTWVKVLANVDVISSERFPDSASISDAVYSAAWWTADSGFWASKVVVEDDTYAPPVDGSDDEPGSGTNGSYSFKITVTSDGDTESGYVPYTFTTRLITLQIQARGGPVSVVAAKRELPATIAVEAAAVKPVAKASPAFTAGPNPAPKGGVISFFSGSAAKNGTLNIFDAGGNLVASVPVGSAGSAGGKIASWTAAAPAGAYVVKGALVNGKTGKREKVSFLFGIAK